MSLPFYNNNINFGNGYVQNMPRMPIPAYNSYANSNFAAKTNNKFDWVQGIEAAKAYQMYPSSMVLLLDSENEGVMYARSCDANGRCDMQIYTYSEKAMPQHTEINMSNYVTKDELESIFEEKMKGLMMNEQIDANAEPSNAATATASKSKQH